MIVSVLSAVASASKYKSTSPPNLISSKLSIPSLRKSIEPLLIEPSVPVVNVAPLASLMLLDSTTLLNTVVPAPLTFKIPLLSPLIPLLKVIALPSAAFKLTMLLLYKSFASPFAVLPSNTTSESTALMVAVAPLSLYRAPPCVAEMLFVKLVSVIVVLASFQIAPPGPVAVELPSKVEPVMLYVPTELIAPPPSFAELFVKLVFVIVTLLVEPPRPAIAPP